MNRWILANGDKSFKNDLQNSRGLGIYIDQWQAPKLEEKEKDIDHDLHNLMWFWCAKLELDD
jgi:hypothetical protein